MTATANSAKLDVRMAQMNSTDYPTRSEASTKPHLQDLPALTNHHAPGCDRLGDIVATAINAPSQK